MKNSILFQKLYLTIFSKNKSKYNFEINFMLYVEKEFRIIYKYKIKNIEKIIGYNLLIKIKNKYNQYKRNILNEYGEKWWKFIFLNNNKAEIEKCHIKSRKLIKKQILANLNNNIKKYLHEISDHNNFLPLKAGIHKLHDKNNLYWDTNGKLNFIEKINLNTEEKQVYQQIPSEHLNKKESII